MTVVRISDLNEKVSAFGHEKGGGNGMKWK
jgi:hypothetical protein